jgi:hypothetical protein
LDVTLAEVFGEEVIRDADGDIPVRYGSTLVFVRGDQEDNLLRVFSPIVREMPPDPAAFDAVNQINLQLPMGKAVVVEDGTGIVVDVTIPADSLSKESVRHVLDYVTEVGDYFDTILVDRFGGKTMLEDLPEDATDV